MNDLEESLIYSWIKFTSIKLSITLPSDETTNSNLIDKDTDPNKFINLKFFCKFAQNNLDFNNVEKNKHLNYENNTNLKITKFNSSQSYRNPEDVCDFFKIFENFCENFFSGHLDSQMSSEMKNLFNCYKKNTKIIYKNETKKNLLLFYKIIFFIRFIEELTVNINTQQINFMDVLQKYAYENKDFFKISMKDPYLFNIMIKIINTVINFSTRSMKETDVTSADFIDKKFHEIYDELQKDAKKVFAKNNDEKLTEKIFTFKKEDFNPKESVVSSFSRLLSKRVHTNSLKNSSIIKAFDTQIKKQLLNLQQYSNIIDEESFVLETDRTQKQDDIKFDPKQMIDLEGFYGKKRKNRKSIKKNRGNLKRSGSESSLNYSYKKSLFSINSSSEEDEYPKKLSNMSRFNKSTIKEEDEHIKLKENLESFKNENNKNENKRLSLILPVFGERKGNFMNNSSGSMNSEEYSKCSIDDSMFEKELDSKLNFIEKNSINENSKSRDFSSIKYENSNKESFIKSFTNKNTFNTIEAKVGDNFSKEKRLRVCDSNSLNNYTNNFFTYTSINLEKEGEETPKNVNYLLDVIVELRKEIENLRSENTRVSTSLRSMKYENVTVHEKLKKMERKNDDYRNLINVKNQIITKKIKDKK